MSKRLSEALCCASTFSPCSPQQPSMKCLMIISCCCASISQDTTKIFHVRYTLEQLEHRSRLQTPADRNGLFQPSCRAVLPALFSKCALNQKVLKGACNTSFHSRVSLLWKKVDAWLVSAELPLRYLSSNETPINVVLGNRWRRRVTAIFIQPMFQLDLGFRIFS